MRFMEMPLLRMDTIAMARLKQEVSVPAGCAPGEISMNTVARTLVSLTGGKIFFSALDFPVTERI